MEKIQEKCKIALDVFMTGLLLLAMGYLLVGEEAHEWIGCLLFVLFVLHHVLNRHWWSHLSKGKCTPARFFQTVLNFLILAAMLGIMASGVLLSRYIFDLHIPGAASFARKVHLVLTYWGFVLLAVHLGLHWGALYGRLQKVFSKNERPAWLAWLLRLAAAAAAVYGAVCLVRYSFFAYMFLQVQFAFFDAEQPLALFLLDHVCILAFWVWQTYYAQKSYLYFLRKRSVQK